MLVWTMTRFSLMNCLFVWFTINTWYFFWNHFLHFVGDEDKMKLLHNLQREKGMSFLKTKQTPPGWKWRWRTTLIYSEKSELIEASDSLHLFLPSLFWVLANIVRNRRKFPFYILWQIPLLNILLCCFFQYFLNVWFDNSCLSYWDNGN